MGLNNTLSYEEIYLNDDQVTYPELERQLEELKEGEVIELVEVDEHGNLYFETHTYGIYY